MIKKLRIKLVAVITGAMLIVFSTIFITLNLFMYRDSVGMTDNFLRMVAEHDGFFLPPRRNFRGTSDLPDSPDRPSDFNNPSGFNSETMRAGRFFYVKIDEAGNIFEVDLNMMFDFTEEDAREYTEIAVEKARNTGNTGSFSYLIADKPYGKIVVFAERSIETNLLVRLASISIRVAGVSCIIVFGLSILLSGWMVNPVKIAFKKQRRFTSDASHELKTPLTIISANADILETEIGSNKRLNTIKAQLSRMSSLIHDLLTLARSDEGNNILVKSGFNLSKAALSTVLEFESRAFEENKRYKYDIAENIFYTGDEKQIKQMLSILIDNAIRHSGEADEIKVTLENESGKIRISVFNTGTGIHIKEINKVFDRFYRSDISRSRETGGYGLGLAIAKSIVDAHKSSISVRGKYGKWVEFTIIMSP